MERKDTESKPFAGYEHFESCVADMQDEGYDQQSAEKICGALQEEYEERGDEEAENLKDELLNRAEAMIDGLELGTFSFVSEPAQPSHFTLFKGENKWDWKSTNTIVKGEEGWEVVYGAVMIPGVTDKQGDVITQQAIRDAAHDFLRSGKINNIDADHDLIINKGTLVETYLLQEDKEYELPEGGSVEYPKGTWMVGVEPEEGIKERIEQGDITGFSIYGQSEKYPLGKSTRPAKTPPISPEKNIKDKNNVENNKIKVDNMEKEEMEEMFEQFETSIKESVDFSDTLTELKESVDALTEQLNKEEEEQEEEPDEKQIESMGDVLEWLEANAPSEVMDMIADALEGGEDEDEDKQEEQEEEPDEKTETKSKADHNGIDPSDSETVIKSRSFDEIRKEAEKELNRGA